MAFDVVTVSFHWPGIELGCLLVEIEVLFLPNALFRRIAGALRTLITVHQSSPKGNPLLRAFGSAFLCDPTFICAVPYDGL